jgi:hypothetical protein
MTDRTYLANVLIELPNVKIHVTPDNPDGVTTSMRKIEIFNYEHIDDYFKILYFDSDIAILGDIMPIFDCLLEPDVLYVKKESNDFKSLQKKEYSLIQYTEDQMKKFEDNGQHPFNAGHFLFRNSQENKTHFGNILELMRTWKGEFFYEQSFLNHYFQANRKYDDVLLDECIDFFYSSDDFVRKNFGAIIVHCVNCIMPLEKKLHNMQHLVNVKLFAGYPISYETRNMIGEVISLPRKPKIAEIGVFRGDFSQVLLDQFRPSMLYLVDPFEEGEIMSGDENGNDVMVYDGIYLYEYVKDRFASTENVKMLRIRSEDLDQCIEDDELDLIYIDGDHSYEGVKRDLEMAYRKVKDQGFICGHDLMTNPHKTDNVYDFGTFQAVQEFCYRNGFRVESTFQDGCVSYAIHLQKPDYLCQRIA